ncbi:MAG TPA: hypothetical protein VKC90_08230 [Chitinophagaceae bacterium]|nr:hypothetical protein [Chitinophagaceae bacterium]
MSQTEQHLKRIQDKLQQLLKQHTVLQKENSLLREELKKNKDQSLQHQQSVIHLKQQIDVLKLNAGKMNETDKKDIEKRINSYLKEIDRCIALLGE